MKSKKLLAPDEQSLLLVSLLFARKHLDEIYSFFSDGQRERMNEAKIRFLRLEQGPRVTQIILELRRLLLINENNFHWIHPSWFKYELAKEPPYLRAIIENALFEQVTPIAPKKSENKQAISPEQVLQNFLTSFTNTPQRVALFDPVLMRLQSLHREQQNIVIKNIGRHTLQALGQALDQERFNKFLKRNYIYLKFSNLKNISENPLQNCAYKNILLKILIAFKNKAHRDIEQELGLGLIALYLYGYKPSWHRMIELVLERSLGISLREKISALVSYKLETKIPLTKLLIDAMDQAG